MIVPQPAKILIARVLQDAAQGTTHTTTKKTATKRALRLIRAGGGRRRYGFTAQIIEALIEESIGVEVGAQLRGGLQPGAFRLPLTTAPAAFIATLRSLPFWIALSEGADPEWRYSVEASPDDWEANASLKYKIASRTRAHGDTSHEIGRWLKSRKLNSLSEIEK